MKGTVVAPFTRCKELPRGAARLLGDEPVGKQRCSLRGNRSKNLDGKPHAEEVSMAWSCEAWSGRRSLRSLGPALAGPGALDFCGKVGWVAPLGSL